MQSPPGPIYARRSFPLTERARSAGAGRSFPAMRAATSRGSARGAPRLRGETGGIEPFGGSLSPAAPWRSSR
jgi:hypothetical protein